MGAECNQAKFEFHPLGSRDVVGRFDGGMISSDGGGLLLREVEQRTGILRQFAGCFSDHRDADLIEHTVEDLLAQRVYGLTLGYEDLLDHDDLRRDPLLATLVGKTDPQGENRARARDRGKPLAGKSTLNRLELTPVGADEDSRYKKIVCHTSRVDALFVDVFLQAHDTPSAELNAPSPPARIVIDLDSTFAPLHGHQLGRFFHGYYDCYCYLPLYVFCGEHLLAATLRPANIDGAAGAREVIQRIVERIRARWPQTQIVLRGDSGFCRENLMAWCEKNGVDYVFGLARNNRLCRIIGAEMHQAKLQCEATGQAARVFSDFEYRTKKSWSRPRRVVGKAEHLENKANPRFVVTSLPPVCADSPSAAREQSSNAAPAGSNAIRGIDARTLYEDEYCARGEMENRIKEQQLYLFADRLSAATMRANQLRLYEAGVAYLLIHALRRLGLRDTPLQQAQTPTIRQKLFKIGVQIVVSTRRVFCSWSQAYPYQELFRRIWENLRGPSENRQTPAPQRC